MPIRAHDNVNAASESAALAPWPTNEGDARRASERLREAIAGRAAESDEAAAALGQAAAAIVQNYAPGAPQALRDEACIRFAGYLANSDYGGFRKEPTSVGGQDGGEYVTNHAPAFRNCGAAMLLTRWKVRRAGPIA